MICFKKSAWKPLSVQFTTNDEFNLTIIFLTMRSDRPLSVCSSHYWSFHLRKKSVMKTWPTRLTILSIRNPAAKTEWSVRPAKFSTRKSAPYFRHHRLHLRGFQVRQVSVDSNLQSCGGSSWCSQRNYRLTVLN
jgi:hypothetical protein